jgi:hypothetical protein
MSTNTNTTEQGGGTGFDLFRLSKSKATVDVCSNTLRSYFKQGLPYYQRGKAVFVSKAELAAFIRRGTADNRYAAANPGGIKSRGPSTPACRSAMVSAANPGAPEQARVKIRRRRITEEEMKRFLGVEMMSGGAA